MIKKTVLACALAAFVVASTGCLWGNSETSDQVEKPKPKPTEVLKPTTTEFK